MVQAEQFWFPTLFLLVTPSWCYCYCSHPSLPLKLIFFGLAPWNEDQQHSRYPSALLLNSWAAEVYSLATGITTKFSASSACTQLLLFRCSATIVKAKVTMQFITCNHSFHFVRTPNNTVFMESCSRIPQSCCQNQKILFPYIKWYGLPYHYYYNYRLNLFTSFKL